MCLCVSNFMVVEEEVQDGRLLENERLKKIKKRFPLSALVFFSASFLRRRGIRGFSRSLC